MSLIVHCPKLKCGGTKDILACIYACAKATVIKCPVYAKAYPALLNIVIPQKYLDRYGEVTLLVPVSLRIRRRRTNTKEEV